MTRAYSPRLQSARRCAPPRQDVERLDRLAAAGYLAKDPMLSAPTYRLTIRGWAIARENTPVAEPVAAKEE